MIAVFLAWITFIAKPASVLAGYDANNLIADSTFVATDSMNTNDIQSFLAGKGSFLKDFSEGGRSAAQIIYDAAHAHGDATASINGISLDPSTGTVSPQVILTMLQKEQGLITMTTRNDASLNVAMSMGCPDGSSCNPAYSGFTKQIENGAWQLRYSYERAQGHNFSDYQVGGTATIDSQVVTFANKATASLYRYNPHLSGNKNFYTLFGQYFVTYSHIYGYQNAYPTLAPGEAYNFVVRFKNTGTATWTKGVVNLGTDRSRDHIPRFTREGDGPSGWTSPNRVTMQEATVAPGEYATYSFWMRNDNVSPGSYDEYFRLVADGILWMEDLGVKWTITTISTADGYHYIPGYQNGYPTLSKGQGYQFVLTVKNTGHTTWTKGVVNLGTNDPQDRIPSFTRECADGSASGWISPNRVTMQEGSVAPGQFATYKFCLRNDSVSSGTYRQGFRVVADGITWMEDPSMYWSVTVP